MAQRLMSFGVLARRAASRACASGASVTFVRPWASAADLAMAEDNAFLKWTTPEPQQYIHAGILAAPQTKARAPLLTAMRHVTHPE